MKKFLSTLLYTAAATLLFSACGMTANTVSSPVEPTVKSNEKTAVNNKALVYFSKDISPVSTCHMLVIPDFIASSARWCSSYLETSLINRGRVPTMLISPPYVNSKTTFRHKKSL